MDVKRAFEIVLDLARQNIFEDDPEQIEACDIIEDIAVNQFGDD